MGSDGGRMMEAMTWTSVCTNLVEKLYQLNLKVGSNPKMMDNREFGYPSMSTIKYAEGFKNKENLYEHSIEFANELYNNGDLSPEDKLRDIIKETRTLVRNELSNKVVATFLNTCLKLTNISPKFYFSPFVAFFVSANRAAGIVRVNHFAAPFAFNKFVFF